MNVVVQTDPGVLELNFMWLPTWIGMNANLKKEIEEELRKEIEGKPLDTTRAHDFVVRLLVKKYPELRGLDHYLDGLKYIEHT
jgi:hypothetical protein